jgi:hypothetical protein
VDFPEPLPQTTGKAASAISKPHPLGLQECPARRSETEASLSAIE